MKRDKARNDNRHNPGALIHTKQLANDREQASSAPHRDGGDLCPRQFSRILKSSWASPGPPCFPDRARSISTGVDAGRTTLNAFISPSYPFMAQQTLVSSFLGVLSAEL